VVKLGGKTIFALACAAGALAVVWGAVLWRMRHATQATIEGELRPGTLRCSDACHFEFTLEVGGGTQVKVEQCVLPDALRDLAGVRVLAAGSWAGERSLRASHLFVTSRSAARSATSGLPPGCQARSP
jgi:hypothetical protein